MSKKPINTVNNLDIAALRRALELTGHASKTLGMNAGDGVKARPTVGQLNDTLDDLTTISKLLDHVLVNLQELPDIDHASNSERMIVGKLVTDILAGDYEISIDDGGGLSESPLMRCSDAKVIYQFLASTDTDRLYVSEKSSPKGRYVGWVLLVWGNDVDVISDYTTNLEGRVHGANQLAEELEA